MTSILEQPTPPAPPVAARAVQPMGEDDMPEQKKRRGRPPKNAANDPAPKKRRRRRRRRSSTTMREIAEKVARAPKRNAAADLVAATFATLDACIDVSRCDAITQQAYKAHRAALELLAG